MKTLQQKLADIRFRGQAAHEEDVGTSPVGRTADFKAWSMKERGRILTGRFAHYCNDWDGLTVDETCVEAESCHDCDYDDKARLQINMAVKEFDKSDPTSNTF